MSERDEQKTRYRAYAAIAQAWAAQHVVGEVRVPEHPQVQEIEDGAFVEATIWVPRSAIDATPR